MSSVLLASVRRILSQPAFVIAASLLLVAALSLNAAVEFMQLHFKKQPVPLNRKLTEMPARLGPWVQVSTDAPIDPETEDVLQTKDYIFRFYLDTRSPRVTQQFIDSFKDKPVPQQRAMVDRLQHEEPHAVMSMAVTYYTGMVDTVSHIPDRCYVADGYQPTNSDVVSWKALQSRRGDGKVRYINFDDQNAQRRSVTKNVAYFFHSNGEYISDPLGVRLKLQNLLETHGYYAKVELLMVTPDREMASRQMNDFLTFALPEVELCLPDWEMVKANQKASAKKTQSASAQ